ESLADLDQYIEAFKAVAQEAVDNPEALHEAPTKTVVRRLDEVNAARKPHLCG
ncbi:MAG: aminomethyl-transferring glycine dehydrogenase subunit GcvPB, partial [Deltaproteobacteria bacterium]|nr:aminomethyl-transferring glycine dehydrogenase subunit GcvPB [Deltaproteobacteria bacterium]